MNRRASRLNCLTPLALSAALVGHTAADAKATDPGKARMSGPDPIAGASAEAAREMGKAYLGLNRVPEALQAYRQALAQDPDSVEALNGMAVCFDRLGRYQDARTHYEAALGIDPTSPVLLNNYGLSLHLQGQHEDAARFLRLAAAAGDPVVQAAALRTLARIERATATAAASQPPAPQMAALPEGPRVVRTSGHEQRLVLDAPRSQSRPVYAAAAPMAANLELVAAIGGLSPTEDARIAAMERAAVFSDMQAAERAAARREAERLMAEARAMVPAEMQVAALLEAARKSPVTPTEEPTPSSPWGDPEEPFMRAPDRKDWHQDQILAMAPAPSSPSRKSVDRAGLAMALLAAGFAPPRDVERAALAAAAQKALDEAAPRRRFDAPFASDNDRLNGFAARLHQMRPEEDDPSVSEQIARLEALIEQVRAA